MEVIQWILVLSLICLNTGIPGVRSEDRLCDMGESCDPIVESKCHLVNPLQSHKKGKEWELADEDAGKHNKLCKEEFHCRADSAGQKVCGRKREARRQCKLGEACYAKDCIPPPKEVMYEETEAAWKRSDQCEDNTTSSCFLEDNGHLICDLRGVDPSEPPTSTDPSHPPTSTAFSAYSGKLLRLGAAVGLITLSC